MVKTCRSGKQRLKPGRKRVNPLPPILPFRCLYCHCGFAVKSAYIRHKKTHLQDDAKKPFMCLCLWPGCEFVTIHQSALNEHVNLHTGLVKFDCLIEGCGWTSLTSSCHTRHVQNVHKTTPLAIYEKMGRSPWHPAIDLRKQLARSLKASIPYRWPLGVSSPASPVPTLQPRAWFESASDRQHEPEAFDPYSGMPIDAIANAPWAAPSRGAAHNSLPPCSTLPDPDLWALSRPQPPPHSLFDDVPIGAHFYASLRERFGFRMDKAINAQPARPCLLQAKNLRIGE